MTALSYLIVMSIAVLAAVFLSIIYFLMIELPELQRKLKSDITPEQMRIQEQRLIQFLEANNLADGTSLEVIADTLKIREGGISTALQNHQAVISQPDASGIRVVEFKPNLDTNERIFAFAHECAHIINGDSTPANRPDASNKPIDEQLADYMAAAILMPLSGVSEELATVDYKSSNRLKRYVILQRLCKKYNVSDIVAARRIKEVIQLKGMK